MNTNQYLAKKLINDLRNGKTIPKDLVEKLLNRKFVDDFYKSQKGSPINFNNLLYAIKFGLKDTDKPKMLSLFENPNLSGLSILLCRKFNPDNDINLKLKSGWQNKDLSFSVKYWLLHELTYRGLKDYDKEIFIYIKNNLEEYLSKEKKYINGDVLSFCEERIKNERFSNKKWIYCLTILGESKIESEKFLNNVFFQSDFENAVLSFCKNQINK